MLDKSVFEKFDLLPMSYSKLNSFSNYPCQFIINKIYKVDTGTNPAMRAGQVVEELLYDSLMRKDVYMDKVLLHFEEDFCNYHDQEKVGKYLEYIPKMYKNCDNFLKQLGNYQLLSYQEEISTSILGINFIGYTDFLFDLDDELWLYDLKTKARMSKPSNSEYLQQWIYKKALEEKYQKPVHCHLDIVTPTKRHCEELFFNDNHEIEIYNKIKGMASLLQKCNTPEDVALLYQPNLDSWEWNEQNIPARKEIWGI